MLLNWNGKDWVVALGQIWRGSFGYRYVPYAWDDYGRRKLLLNWYDFDWFSDYRFLAVPGRAGRNS